MTKTKKQLILENEELNSRLVVTEETLAAIRNGEVDAIIVPGRNGEQVYSGSSSETPYRTFIEEMGEGAVTLSKDGIILYCNQRFSDFVQSPYERVVGSYLKNFLSPNDNPKFDYFLAQMTHGKKDVLIVTLTSTLHLRLSIHLLPPYLQGDNFILIATDITDLKKKEIQLKEIIVILTRHIKALQALRIENINQTLDAEGRENKIEIANNELYNEITKLNHLVAELKQTKNITT
jgi:two-component system, OmpR family, phosphate regulon sensor histidine kinase PhoR